MNILCHDDELYVIWNNCILKALVFNTIIWCQTYCLTKVEVHVSSKVELSPLLLYSVWDSWAICTSARHLLCAKLPIHRGFRCKRFAGQLHSCLKTSTILIRLCIFDQFDMVVTNKVCTCLTWSMTATSAEGLCRDDSISSLICQVFLLLGQ